MVGDDRMERFALKKLKEWKDRENRKPLIIRGDYVKIGLNQEKPYK